MSWRLVDIILHFQLLSLALTTLGVIVWLIGYRLDDASYAKTSAAIKRIGIIITAGAVLYTAAAWIIEPSFEIEPSDLEQSSLITSKTYHPIKYSFNQSIYNQEKHTFIYELKPGYVHSENVYLVEHRTLKSPRKQAKDVDLIVYSPKSNNPIVRYLTIHLYQCYGTTLRHHNTAVVIRITKYQKE